MGIIRAAQEFVLALPPIKKTVVAQLDIDVLPEPRVLYSLQEKQFECFKHTPIYLHPEDDYPGHIGYGGAAGGGKSYLTRAVHTAAAILWEGSTSIIFRKTEREVKENHVNKFRSEVPNEIEGHKIYSWNGDDLCATFWNGSRIYFGYLKQDDDVFRYQGPEYDIMTFEESTHYSWWQVNWLISNRLRATVNVARPFAMFPSNPGSKGMFWYKRLFIDRKYHEEEEPKDYVFVQALLRDNQELVRRDPRYSKKLNRLPEPWKSWMRDGDFKKGAGSAIAELDRDLHIVEPFRVPPNWTRFGSFDWGYWHPWSFGEWAIDEDGTIYKLQTITGQYMKVWEIAEKIKRHCDVSKLHYTVAGHDLWAKRRSLSIEGETMEKEFAELGIPLTQANIDRVQGLNALRARLSWEQHGQARMYFVREPGNMKAFEQLETRTVDEDDYEDVVKTDADEWGEGGDDMYDETRYGCVSAPVPSEEVPWLGYVAMGDPATLAYERDQKMKVTDELIDVDYDREVMVDEQFGVFI